MRRRTVVLICAAAIILFAVVLLVTPEREPRYQGRTLSEWLVQAQTNLTDFDLFLLDSGSTTSRVSAVCAVWEIGPRAVPELVGWIKRPAPLFEEEVRAVRNMIPGMGAKQRRYPYRADLAVFGFRVLGLCASGAAPQLTSLMKDRKVSQQTRECAMAALARLGPAGLQPLLDAFSDPGQPGRRLAAYHIGSMRYLGTNASPAAAVLIRLLKDDEEQIAGRAAAALGDLNLEPAQAIPALTNALKDPRPGVRASAASAIGAYGKHARPALPALTEALSDPKIQVRTAVTNALYEIRLPRR